MFIARQIKSSWELFNCFHQLPPPLNGDHVWPAHWGARSYWLHRPAQRKTGSLQNPFHVPLFCHTVFWEAHFYIPCSTWLRQMFKITSHRIWTNPHLYLTTSSGLQSEALFIEDCKHMLLKHFYINMTIWLFSWYQFADLFFIVKTD